jgi:hypothetical protein
LSTSRLLVLIAALAAPALPGGSARAERGVQTYQAAVARGARAFQDGDYVAARRYFQMGYQIHQEPVLLFNIASTYRREAKRELALRYYRRFLAEADEKDSLRALAIKTVAELEEELAPALREEPLPEEKASSSTVTRKLTVDRPDEDAHPGRPFKWAAAGAGVAAVASFALAWQAGSQARAAQNYLESLPADQPWDLAQDEAYQDGKAANRRALVFAIAGSALAASGVVLFTIGHMQGREAAASVGAAPTSGGGGLVLSGRF